MANLKASKKSVKQTKKRRLKNLARRTAIKTAIRKVLDSLEAKDQTKTLELFNDMQAKLSRAKGKGVIHANAASRKVSRIAAAVKKAYQAAA